ncbi:transposase [Candidatus Dependentiae bacterium]|nr:transposase [Candidatus Dependentiae bacterium]
MKQTLAVIRLQLTPDKVTAACLDDQSRKCNVLYNKVLENAYSLKESFKATGDLQVAQLLYSAWGLRNLVPGIKSQYPYLKSVYSAPLKNAALRVTESIKAYQQSRKGKRKGAKTGWPRFRSWSSSWFSLLYDEPLRGYKFKGNTLILSLGTGSDNKRHSLTVPMSDGHVLEGKEVRNLRIVKESGIFSAVITIVRSVPETKPIKRVLALDPNHKNFAYGVDNEGKALEIAAPFWLKVFDLRLDGLKSKLDRCKKRSYLIPVVDAQGNLLKQRWQSSRRYNKIATVYAKARTKRRELTKLFCYRLSNYLYKQYDLVAVGDYTPRGNGITTPMRRAMNNRSLIGRFKEILSWVALKSGKSYHEFAEKGTTRTCHACEFIVPNGLAPHVRQWTCPSCSAQHIRDENAACNGLRKTLRDLSLKSKELSLPVPSSGHVLIKERWAWRVASSSALCTAGIQ